MSGDIKERMKAIRKIEDRYGVMLFGMGLIQLVDIGYSNITDDYVSESIAKIAANGETSIMTPAVQCNIIRCAAELTQFSPMTLLAYIKRHMHIGGV